MTGAELQAARLRHGWTIRQAAEAAELAPATVRRLEERRRPSAAQEYDSGRRARRSAYKLGLALGLVEPLADERTIAASADARAIAALAKRSPMSAAAIAHHIGETDKAARGVLRRLVEAGLVEQVARSRLTHAGSEPAQWSLTP
jgi:transcriptional regulator with XRE-family HTH domain